MSFLKQIDDKGAVLEWSPVASQPNMVALGTQVSLYIYVVDHESLNHFISYYLGLSWIWI
jgi:hypothetical protein